MSQDDLKRESLVQAYRKRIGPLPEKPPLDMRVTGRRRLNSFGEYEEWRVEYTGWTAASMPEPALRRIPAYILIPAGERGGPPYPAALCFHQCNCDCWIGKEAVVGRNVDRPDQAYGLELVRQGFAVLAPDHILCGERSAPHMRGEAEPFSGDCIPVLSEAAGAGPGDDLLRLCTFDVLRSVDLLESLSFVDPTRILAVGHSLGAGDVCRAMAADARIGIGITSGGGPNEELAACIAPRLFMQLQGRFDGGPERVRQSERIHARTRGFYETAGAPDNLVLDIAACNHCFIDGFKWRAYARAKRHFGMLPPVEKVDLGEVVRSAFASWDDGGGRAAHWLESFPDVLDSCMVEGNGEVLAAAFALLLTVIARKHGEHLPLRLSAAFTPGRCAVRFTVPGGSALTRGAKDHPDGFIAGQRFADSGAELRQSDTPGALQYLVTLGLAS
jgi:dienelactone hydrolase